MKKQFADDMIAQFQNKFFGFALSKCNDFAEAEELAGRITCEAYITLRTVEDVYNWEGYLYKIASNVYAHYVKEQMKRKIEGMDGMDFATEEDFSAEFIKKEELERLKREVAWLSKRHREIILLHYYHNKKLAEIAEILKLPEGTVKWHLSDAKKMLREGMKRVRIEGNLGLEPIELIHMGNVGSPGTKGDTNGFLNSKLRQNIVYAAYFEARTIEEIAGELNVSPVFVEDEVVYLEEWGFLDLMPGQKYRANVFIDCTPYEALLQLRELEYEVVKMLCDEYIPEVIARAKNYDKTRVYVPEEDMNYFLWSLIPLALTQYSMGKFDWATLRKMNYIVQRKDGGNYAAVATLYQKEVEEVLEKEYICGPMYVSDNKIPVSSWSVGTTLLDRDPSWEDNIHADYVAFGMFLKGKMPKTEAVLDKYIRFYDRGLLRQLDDKVNVIVVKQCEEDGFFALLEESENLDLNQIDFTGYLRNYIPKMSNEMLQRMNALCEKRVRMEQAYYPKHMHPMLKILRTAREINVFMVIEELQKRGVLQPLTDVQKKGVMNIVYCDTLPE